MKGLLDQLLSSGNQGALRQLAGNFGLGEADTQNVLKQLVPALAGGLKRNTASQGGMESLMNALKGGGHDRYIDQPDTLGRAETVQDGNAILGHLFGSKDVSRQVADRAAAGAGVESGIIKKMLPVIAAMTMGSMGKTARATPSAASAGAANPLLSMLDRDADGSVVDDLLGMAKKLF